MQNDAGFDRFTERARKALILAQDEAQRFNHNYIGTEHLLLGLAGEGEGIAAQVLSNLGMELTRLRSAVELIIGLGEEKVTSERGLTHRARKAIEGAVDEARRLGHTYIGTEHLLLGLIRVDDGIAAGALESLGASLEEVRSELITVLIHTGSAPTTVASQPPPHTRQLAWEYLAVPVRQQETNPDPHTLVCGPPVFGPTLPHDIGGMSLGHTLRLLGEDGWELAGIDSAYPSDDGRASLYLFKRAQ